MAQRKAQQPKAKAEAQPEAQTVDAQPSPLGEVSETVREVTTQEMTNGTKREDF